MKVQEPNIEGLTSFEKKENERERMKEKRRKEKRRNNSPYSQQIWRMYNHVKT